MALRLFGIISVLSLLHTNAYYLTPNHLTWEQSKQYCHNYCSSHLASIHSKLQNDDMISTIQSGHSFATDSSNVQAEQIFIGLYDNVSISNYKWIDGTPFDFGSTFYIYPWLESPAQPGSLDIINCGQIRVTDDSYRWDDIACTRTRRALCNDCSGKLNKFTVVNRQYDYAGSNTQCQTQAGSKLAHIHSPRDLYELQTLCSLYDNPSDCWLTWDGLTHLNHTANLQSVSESAMMLKKSSSENAFALAAQRVDEVGYPLCYIPSELCRTANDFAVFNGHFLFEDECQIYASFGRNDAIIANKEYLNPDGIVRIDYLFMIDTGRAGIILPVTPCSAYYIGLSLKDEHNKSNKLFVQYVEYNGTHTDFDTIPLVQIKLDHAFNTSIYHLLSIEAQQVGNKLKLSVSVNEDNHIEVLVWEHSTAAEIDLTSVAVGLWSEHANVQSEYLYVSGTPMLRHIDGSNHGLGVCMSSITNHTATLPPTVKITLTFTFAYFFDAHTTLQITNIVEHVLSHLLYPILSECVAMQPLQSVNYPENTSINAFILVCNTSQQQPLLTMLNAHSITTDIVLQINDARNDLHISANYTHLQISSQAMLMDANQHAIPTNITSTLHQQTAPHDGNNGTKHDHEEFDAAQTRQSSSYFGTFGEEMGIVLLSILATLAGVSVTAVCIICCLHFQKLRVLGLRSLSNSHKDKEEMDVQITESVKSSVHDQENDDLPPIPASPKQSPTIASISHLSTDCTTNNYDEDEREIQNYLARKGIHRGSILALRMHRGSKHSNSYIHRLSPFSGTKPVRIPVKQEEPGQNPETSLLSNVASSNQGHYAASLDTFHHSEVSSIPYKTTSGDLALEREHNGFPEFSATDTTLFDGGDGNLQNIGDMICLGVRGMTDFGGTAGAFTDIFFQQYVDSEGEFQIAIDGVNELNEVDGVVGTGRSGYLAFDRQSQLKSKNEEEYEEDEEDDDTVQDGPDPMSARYQTSYPHLHNHQQPLQALSPNPGGRDRTYIRYKRTETGTQTVDSSGKTTVDSPPPTPPQQKPSFTVSMSTYKSDMYAIREDEKFDDEMLLEAEEDDDDETSLEAEDIHTPQPHSPRADAPHATLYFGAHHQSTNTVCHAEQSANNGNSKVIVRYAVV